MLWLYKAKTYIEDQVNGEIVYGITSGDDYGEACNTVVADYGADYCDDITIAPLPTGNTVEISKSEWNKVKEDRMF